MWAGQGARLVQQCAFCLRKDSHREGRREGKESDDHRLEDPSPSDGSYRPLPRVHRLGWGRICRVPDLQSRCPDTTLPGEKAQA